MSEPSRKPPFILRRPGGEVNRTRVFNAPGVVLFFVVATIGVFIMMLLAPERVVVRIIETTAAVSPPRLLAGPEANGGVFKMVTPLVAHMFVHAGIAHLVINTMFLLAFGAPVARRLGAQRALESVAGFFASVWFAAFYILSGAAGALFYVVMHANEFSLLIGASGGVSGLLGGLVRFAFNRTTLFGPEHARISALTSPSVLTWSAVFVGINLAVGLFGGPFAGGAQIAWEAHLGGYFFGLLTYPLFERIAGGGRR